MAVPPNRPTPFFANKNRAFWNLQIAGWGGSLLFRGTTGFANGKPLSFLVIVLIATITGFSITLILSVVYRHLLARRPIVTWGLTTAALLLAVMLSAFLNGWANSLYYPANEANFVLRFLGLFYLDATLLVAWSALYYAINYYLQVERQAGQLEKLELQATTAQLAMLRYQLNPHFLFNTLNSISTLVLLKQTAPANAMLTRLSAFLRHTLVNEPGSQVTVAQEVETLQLYLDIERMRFEERLRTEFTIEPSAHDGCLPSLLLQPLVENAIKYAVSPQEEGAEIRLDARIVGPRLRITVSDTGPGIHADPRADRPGLAAGPSSTGVGLANIRDRLAQAYGEDHRFEIRTPPEGGFIVIIELPYQPQVKDPASSVGGSLPAARPSATRSPSPVTLKADA